MSPNGGLEQGMGTDGKSAWNVPYPDIDCEFDPQFEKSTEFLNKLIQRWVKEYKEPRTIPITLPAPHPEDV